MKKLWAGMAAFSMLAATACASHAPDEAGPAPISRADNARDSTGLQVQIDNREHQRHEHLPGEERIAVPRRAGRWPE